MPVIKRILENKSQDNIVCPVCMAQDTFIVRFPSKQVLGSFAIAQCQSCSHRFLSNPPANHELEVFYNQEYADYEQGRRTTRPGFRDRVLVRTLTRLLPDNARVLDIGTNSGRTLLAFPKSYQLEGVELSGHAAVVASHSKRLTIYNKAIEELELEEDSYDCIVSLAVIEHICDPRAFLKKINTLLSANGILVLMTGDYQSWYAQEKDDSWHLYHSDGHLHFFSMLSLEYALQSAGLQPFRRLWTGPNPFSSQFPTKIARLMHCQTTSIFAPQIFTRQQLGDHLYVWARHSTHLGADAS